MKKLVLVSTLALLISGCSGSVESSSSFPDGSNTSQIDPSDSSSSSLPDGEYIEDISSIQDTTILHAWNWKMNDIKSYLNKIDKAGYKTIQISPMQPNVNKRQYIDGQSTKNQWWRLYQPLDFIVAKNDDNFLGNKSDLTDLCNEAKKHDIKIVVDIVSNHLAGTNGVYNDQVYHQYQLHTYNGNTDDNSAEATVRGRVGGLPDVDTSTSDVQNAVSAMLKEYIDCGVSGFRFDTAKHIETPDDGEFASQFWPTVLGSASSYAKSKGVLEPYYYGEILYNCGNGRKFSSYTKYMSVTDNVSGSDVLTAVKNGNANDIIKNYPTNLEPDKLVLWAESHDTYANDGKETTDIPQSTINKAFVIQNTREDAASLYLARPESWSTQICQISEKGWQDAEIMASNYFHRIYNQKSETQQVNGSTYINIRGENEYAGAAIVDVSNTSSVSLNLDKLNKQKYIDLATGKEYSLGEGNTTVTLTNGCALLVPSSLAKNIPTPKEDDSYSSSIVIQNANQNKAYYAWHWQGSGGSWAQFSTDKDAIGVTISSGENYIIVELDKNKSIDWSNVERQTNDLYFDGNQKIYKYSDIVWKS